MPECKFVYPSHPIYEPFLNLAETTELQAVRNTEQSLIRVRYDHAAVPIELAFSGGPLLGKPWTTETAPAWALEPGKIEEQFWFLNGGINTLSHLKSWPDGYVNEGYRIYGHWSSDGGDSPQANEILSWGVGTLRPRAPEHAGVGEFLAAATRRVDSRRRVAYATYIVDIGHHDGKEWGTRPYALESTNLIMPETLGELRQLSSRRSEKGFIADYLADLLRTVAPVPVPDWSEFRGPVRDDPDTGDKSPAPESIAYSKWRWREAHRAHINAGIWPNPPHDTKELMDRVDQLLESIEIDSEPTDRIRQPKPSPELLKLMAEHPGAL